MNISDFIRYVLTDVSGCPSATAKLAVLDAATEFLTYSGAWNEVQDPIELADGEQEYELVAPTGARCIDIKEVYTLANRLTPVTLEQLARVMPNWQTATGNVPAYYTRAFDFTSIRLYPMPQDPAGETITVHAVLTLKETATTIPDVIVQRYKDPITSGAKARLMIMSNVPWRDLPSAQIHKGIFDDGKLAAKITAQHGKTAGCLVVTPRPFGRSW